MQSVLITNGGPHTADAWAEATASHIVGIATHVSGTRRGAAIKLQAAIIDILTEHHSVIIDGERDKIKEHGDARLIHANDPEHHLTLDEATAEIVACGAGTPWETDFSQPEFKAQLTDLLSRHFKTSIHVERSWHADRNPTAPEAIEFRKTHNVGS